MKKSVTDRVKVRQILTPQEAYDVLEDAFSSFMVADMDTRRCDVRNCEHDEAEFWASRDAERVGRIIAHVYKDSQRLYDAICLTMRHRCGQLPVPVEPVVADVVEGCRMPLGFAPQHLCCKYQLDADDPDIIEMYVCTVFDVITDTIRA